MKLSGGKLTLRNSNKERKIMFSMNVFIKKMTVIILPLLFVFTNGILDLPEGSIFEMNKLRRSSIGKTGVCVKYYTCLTLAVDFYKNRDDDVEICSFDGDLPIICCTACDWGPDIDIRTAYMSPAGYLHLGTGDFAKDKCEEYSHQLERIEGIIGFEHNINMDCDVIDYSHPLVNKGRDAYPAEYPHMALLGYGEDPKLRPKWKCGGSLISEKFILTAGHCIATAEDGPVRYAAVGLTSRSEILSLRYTDVQEFMIKKIIKHPDYNSPSHYNDIALLETHRPVRLSRNVIPACLPVAEDQEKIYYFKNILNMTVTGWGNIGYRGLPADTLQVATVKDFEEEQCKNQYSRQKDRHLASGYNHTTQMCCGSHDIPVDTCKGDSGGPLQINMNNMYTILGVTSAGHACGVSNRAGLYSRVSFYVPWIVNTIWPDNKTNRRESWTQQIRKLYERNPKYHKNSTKNILQLGNAASKSANAPNNSDNLLDKRATSKSTASLSRRQGKMFLNTFSPISTYEKKFAETKRTIQEIFMTQPRSDAQTTTMAINAEQKQTTNDHNLTETISECYTDIISEYCNISSVDLNIKQFFSLLDGFLDKISKSCNVSTVDADNIDVDTQRSINYRVAYRILQHCNISQVDVATQHIRLSDKLTGETSDLTTKQNVRLYKNLTSNTLSHLITVKMVPKSAFTKNSNNNVNNILVTLICVAILWHDDLFL